MTKECRSTNFENAVHCNSSSFVIRASSFAARLPISSRLELWWALSFSHRAGDRDVIQLGPVDSATEKQSATAHVAAPDEIGGETKALTEMFQKYVDVFRGGDAAEKDDLGICRQFFRQTLNVPLERPAITRIVLLNVDFSELAEIGETDWGAGRDKAACRRDDENR